MGFGNAPSDLLRVPFRGGLARAGAVVCLLIALAVPVRGVTVDLVSTGVVGRYLIPTNDVLGRNWTLDVGFDDSLWTTGRSAIGYQVPGASFTNYIRTAVPKATGALGTIDIYTRWSFVLTNAITANAMTLRVRYDDGFAAYLNGQLVAASNAPASPTYNSLATAAHPDAQAVQFESFDLAPFIDLLHPGTNVLAVQVMNFTTTPLGGDLLVEPWLEASVYTPAAGGGVVINEIHSSPSFDADLVKFVELFNTTTAAVSLAGWHFDDGIDFTFGPGVAIPAQGYLAVAESPVALSNKYPVTALGPFAGKLRAEGERVILRNGLGEKVDEVTYGLGFPWPTVGDAPERSMQLLNPALDRNLGGSWRSGTPTPGRSNVVMVAANRVPPQIRQVDHTPRQPVAGEPVLVTAKVTDAEGVSAVVLQYQLVSPGSYITRFDAAYTNSWTNLAMVDNGTAGDALAADSIYSVQLPGALQAHRRMVRYRITVTDTQTNSVRVPYADDPQPNFAYYVYNGVPAWSGAARPGVSSVTNTFGADVMGRLPVYHLLAKRADVEDCTWLSKYEGSDYLWTGTLVWDGEVYDHIGFRARGGVWRYSMGKNAWKIGFNRGHYLEVADDWGRVSAEKVNAINLRAIIQQANFGHRGEQGMFESVGLRLFNMVGTAASRSRWVTLRIVDEAGEAGASQFSGDFWGLYLAVEDMDGHFLDEHALPDGNLYEIEGGQGTLHNQGRTAVTNKSDINTFMNTYTTHPAAPWWRANVNVEQYYGLRAIMDGIHHYDNADGKNYFYYLNPVPPAGTTNQLWSQFPWDIDLTWADGMYGSGNEPFKANGLLDQTELALEHRNRVREIRDLLFNADEGWRLVDEHARLLVPSNGLSIAEADRCMWDYNPVMTNEAYLTHVGNDKAGQGRFYQIAPTKDFAGMVKIMRDYIVYRGSGILDTQATDQDIPNTPTVSAATNVFPANALTFICSSFADPQGNNTFGAMRWRLGEITLTNAPGFDAGAPQAYEIDAVWDSGVRTGFVNTITVPNDIAKVGRTYRLRVKFRDNTGRWSRWSAPVQFAAEEPSNAAALVQHLRVTEVMYDPPAGSAYEYVELFNTSSNTPLDLNGVVFTDGIGFTFTNGTVLPPQGYLLAVQAPAAGNFAAFRAHYGLSGSVLIAGPYSGSLANSGELLKLKTASAGNVIMTTAFSDGRGWPLAAGGAGHALVPKVMADQAGGLLDYGGNWRAGTYRGGSPGAADPAPPAGVILNEIIAHSDYTNASMPEYDSNDWIELFNPPGAPAVTMTNWFLSDDASDLRKWMIPAGTTLAAGGRCVFTEVADFHQPITNGFGLDKSGEAVFLSHLPGSIQDRVVDCVAFKGQENDVAWGRYTDANAWWRALVPPTTNSANGPALATVVISELMPHPKATGSNPEDNTNDEFIELHNPTTNAINLWSPDVGPWRMDGGVSYVFPTNTSIPAGGYLVLVPFNPATEPVALAAFQQAYSVTSGPTRILGPYDGKLANDGERVALERGVAPDLPGDPIPWAIMDEVIYFNDSPWPVGIDATGLPLQRRKADRPGSDPANWAVGSLATPGRAGVAVTNESPYVLWERAWFGESGLPEGAPGADWDVDGASNWDEYVSGTNPTDNGDHLTLGISLENLAAVVQWLARLASGEGYDGLAGRYDLESATNLVSGPWASVPGYTNVPGGNGTVRYTNSVDRLRMYRINVRLE